MIPKPNQCFALWPLLGHSHVTRDDIVAYQNKQLGRLIAHAYRNVPYYRKMFDQNGLKPQDIKTTADLALIPVTSKNDLQSLPDREVLAQGIRTEHLVVHKTSGSSGKPSIIKRTWLEERLLNAFRWRAMRHFGLRITDKATRVILTRPTQQRLNELPLQILQALGLYRSMLIDCRLPPKEIVSKLWHSHPDVVGGFPGVLWRCAEIVANDHRLAIRPRFVVVGGEVLTPLMRHQISEAFSSPVFELYSSHEFNLIAWECMETGELHTCDDSVIVEILTDGRPATAGERGEMVGTALHSFAMPFIRYRLGDIVTKGSEMCTCGAPYSTIGKIQGRMIDHFPLPGGRVIHPYDIVVKIVREASPWIRQYQLTQEREDRIVLQVVPSSNTSPQRIAQLTQSVTALLGRDVTFHVMLVPEIHLEPSGKFRVSRSLVKSAYDGIDWERSQSARPSA
jgi:phenylacetate-CoA ligase